jgi:hypothetical protein
MPKHKKSRKKPNKPLDTFSEKRGRGRPARMRASEIRGRADNYRGILNHVWDWLWPLLSQARSEADIIRAFQEGASPYDREFVPAHATLVLRVLQEPRFPKRREPQINFLSDSLAGVGLVSPRRSRDICERHRADEKLAHHIIRYEFWVECSCGYKGRSWDHACRKCGATIPFSVSSLFQY